ncbi:MAG: endonuclease/exonuclease/phosphatase family protein [Pseudomonadota bacterium]
MSLPRIRIASYNIRKTRGRDRRHDPGRVLDVINAMNADVVVLQEADFRLGKRKAALPRKMIAAHSDFDVAPLAQYEDSLGWHGNVVLTRGGVRVADTTRLHLPGLEPRGAAMVALTGPVRATLVATHLGLRRRDRRRQQAAICAALPPGAPAVIAGDFNEWSSRSGLEGFQEALVVHAPGSSFPAGLPLAPLDRFATSADLKVVETGVGATAKARVASDHLPVWCTVAPAAA